MSRMRKILMMFLMATLAMAQAMAQKTCVIASAEDHVPIREALIHTDNNHWARTDYRGYFTMRYEFDSATVSKPGFVKATIYLKNLPDTVFMLPEAKQIGEVTVWGKNQEHIKKMEEGVQDAASEIPQQSGVSFDFANMIDKRGRRDHKHMKEAQKIFRQMDCKDPIVAAYEKATGKKYQLQNPNDVSATKPKDEQTVESPHKNGSQERAGNQEKNGSQEMADDQEDADGKSTAKHNPTVSIESSVSISR